MLEKLKQCINDGEGLTVEFKLCKNELHNSVFETVSSFSDRYGGYILLGVEDNGDVEGVNPKSVEGMKKNFANLIDAYDQMMDFIAKHTLDRFHLIGDQSVSLRSKISCCSSNCLGN